MTHFGKVTIFAALLLFAGHPGKSVFGRIRDLHQALIVSFHQKTGIGSNPDIQGTAVYFLFELMK
jgi:hypothetical protein